MDAASSEIIDQIGKFWRTWRKKIFQKVGCPIEGNNIEAFHRTNKKKWKDNSEILELPKCT